MRTSIARVREIQSQAGGLAAWIDCPTAAIPAVGQYTLAVNPEDESALVASPVFLAERGADGFLAAPPVPAQWMPGTTLILRGPLGYGFSLPVMARRVALAAFDETADRLLPLVSLALAQGAAVALFNDAALPSLPSAVEAYPFNSLPELLAWADFLALCLPIAALPELRSRLGMGIHERLSCPAQALVLAAMPCGGLAECGVCAIPAPRGWKLACKDGPVFNLEEILW